MATMLNVYDRQTRKKTAVLQIPFSTLYAPFLIFIVFSAIYLIRDCVRDVIVLRTPKEVLLERKAAEKAAIAVEEEGGAE
jgi:TRAP-type C4-dicarboxylate transport system permease small subunit